MMIHYVLDSGLPRTCMLQSGQDTVAAFRRALKYLNKTNKDITESSEDEIEVYLFGVNHDNYQQATPLKANDHLPKGSNSTDRYFFVHLPQHQNLTAEKRSLSPARPPQRRGRQGRGTGPSLPGNRSRSTDDAAVFPRGGGPSLPGNRSRSTDAGAFPRGGARKPRGGRKGVGGGTTNSDMPGLRKSRTSPPGSITREKLGLGPDPSSKQQHEEEAKKKAEKEEKERKRLEAEEAKAREDAKKREEEEKKRQQRQREEEEAAAAARRRKQQQEEEEERRKKRLEAEAKAKREEEERRRKKAEEEEAARRAAMLECFYRVGERSKSPESINMKRGETVKQLKERILGNGSSSSSKQLGVTHIKDLKIFLPATAAGKAGKELNDDDIVPDTSTLAKPLIVKPTQHCFYKIGTTNTTKGNNTNNTPAETTAFVEGDTIKTLKDKILGTSTPGVKNPQDLKIFLPDKDGKPGKELSERDTIPTSSSLDTPLIVKRNQRCFYKVTGNGKTTTNNNKTEETEFLEGDSIKSLKEKIVASQKRGSPSNAPKEVKDFKIYLPGRNGMPDKELKDNDSIPDTSTFDRPLIVKKMGQCFYKMGGNNSNKSSSGATKADSTTFVEGDSVKSLKEKIFASQRGSSPNAPKEAKDFKIYLPGRNGLPGKELSDNDPIPDTSTLDKPLVVQSTKQCFYQLGERESNNNNRFGGQKTKPDAITFTEGESVRVLKEKILESQRGKQKLGGVKDTKDLKIFLPGRMGQPGKELTDNDIIPDTTSLQLPLIVKKTQQCFYKMGKNGKPDSTTFVEGDSVKSLKNKILAINKGSSNGVKDAQDLKVYLPDKDGNPGKELNDNDSIPNTSSLDKPLIVKRKQQCFYKMGGNNKSTTKADATTFMEGDSLKSLREKIFASQRGGPNAPKEAKDIKIYLPGRNGMPGKELLDDDPIPDTSTVDKPLVVQSTKQCFYQLGNKTAGGNPNALKFQQGETARSLKDKILQSHKGDLEGIKDAKDLKIFLPSKNGQPGKELKDTETIPDASSLDMPLIVKRPQKCVYKLEKNSKPEECTLLEGDSVASLKETILAANRRNSALNGATSAKDIKIFLPSSNNGHQLGKELADKETIPATSSSTIPFLVRAGVPVGTSDVFMAFTMPMCKKEPSKADQEALAVTTADFYRSHLQKSFDNFSNVDVSVSNVVFGQGKPSKSYDLYVEWNIQVWFNKAGSVPDRYKLCSCLVKEIDMMTYLMKHVRSLPGGNSFTGVTGMFTEQVNS